MLTEAIKNSQQLTVCIAKAAQGSEFAPSDRNRLSAALLDQVHEHHKAILLLLKNECIGSALALLRGTFEAAVRGAWLLRCASDADIDRFKRGKVRQEFRELVTDVEGVLGSPSSTLSYIKRSSWCAMCSYAHAGYLQAIRRITPTDVGPTYTEAERLEVLALADFCLIFASAVMCSLCNKNEAAHSIAMMLEVDGEQG